MRPLVTALRQKLCRLCETPAECLAADRCHSRGSDPIDPAGLSREVRQLQGLIERTRGEDQARLALIGQRVDALERRLAELERREQAARRQ